MNRLLHLFSELGSQYGLSFSSQEVFRNSIIGLDGLRRKVLVLDRSVQPPATILIGLDDVTSVSVKKQYGKIQEGALPKRKLDHYLEVLLLHFEFSDQHVVEIPCYRRGENHLSELKALEQKARQWEAVLTKMLKLPTRKIA